MYVKEYLKKCLFLFVVVVFKYNRKKKKKKEEEDFCCCRCMCVYLICQGFSEIKKEGAEENNE